MKSAALTWHTEIGTDVKGGREKEGEREAQPVQGMFINFIREQTRWELPEPREEGHHQVQT